MEGPTHHAPSPDRAALDIAGAEVASAVGAEPTVLAAYLFGSVVRGAAGPLSDLDVAVLVPEERLGDFDRYLVAIEQYLPR